MAEVTPTSLLGPNPRHVGSLEDLVLRHTYKSLATLALCVPMRLTPVPRFWHGCRLRLSRRHDEATEVTVHYGRRAPFYPRRCASSHPAHSPMPAPRDHRAHLMTGSLRKANKARGITVTHEGAEVSV